MSLIANHKGAFARRYLVKAIAAALLSSTIAAPALVTSATPAAAMDSAEMAARMTFGFPVDASTEANLDGLYGPYRGQTRFLPAEKEDLHNRLNIQAATSALMSAMSPAALADLATMYYDQRDGGRLHITFAQDVPAHQAEVQGLFTLPGSIIVGSAAHSRAELDSTVDRLSRFLGTSTVPWTSVDRDDVSDVVVVRVLNPSPTTDSDIRSAVGDLPFIVAASAGPNTPAGATNQENSSDHSAPPIVAGLQISRPTSDPTLYTICSLAYYVKDVTGARYMMTAGHCFDPSNIGRAWSVGCCPGLYPVGTGMGARFNNGDSTDSAQINITAYSGQKPEVYCDGNFNCAAAGIPQVTNNFYVSYTGQLNDGDDVTNAQMCDVGVSPYNSPGYDNYCGGVTSTNSTINYGAFDGWPALQITNARTAGVNAQKGMSGGAVYAPGAEPHHYNTGCLNCAYNDQAPVHAIGIVSGMTGSNNLIYTHVQYALPVWATAVVWG